jgi:IS30 family transposase
MVSKNRSCGLLTYVERKTRYVVIGRIENWTSDHIHEETMRILDRYKERIRSITIDNGKEFGEAEVT